MPRPYPANPAERQRDEIEAVIARFAALHHGHSTPVPGLSVARITTPVPPTAQVDAACLCICVRGSRRISNGDSVIFHEENHFVLTAVELPSIIAIPDASPHRPYTALRIDLDLNLARQVMAEIDIDTPSHAPGDTCLAVIKLDPAMLDCVARLVRLLERPGDIAFISKLIHQEILYRLLSGPGGARLRRIVRLGSQGHRVATVIEWLNANFRERLRIEQLAEKAGMGVSTLHRHFNELTGMSPIQYQKQLRLHEARRLMMEEELEVGMVALKVGYESATQFIREYRRLFGAPPMRDVKTIREAGQNQKTI
ncbi:AraC family transcriptional regulator [Dyella sp.]|uniref:AraC family transcriptional regulator n=1 Tax=Dyella sp. TaxID=1869338 RepID=UPI002ED103D1